MSKPTCFIISAIGESGSRIRQDMDDLRDLLIKPILESYDFEVLRGDHRSEAGQIDIDVIRAVQESDLCIVDLSYPNPNVYYEFGRRDETGKPLILLKSKGSDELPVDVATRRYIEYDLDSRRSLIDARTQLQSFVEPIVQKGFESSGTGSSLSELAEILRRLERKVDRLGHNISSSGLSGNGGSVVLPPGEIPPDTDPVDLLNYSLRQRNLHMAENAMNLLAPRMNRIKWLDRVVEQVAMLGSIQAGDIMIQNAIDFIDNTESFKAKADYIGCLVTNLLRTDRELENLELVEELCKIVLASKTNQDEDKDSTISIYNQLNRLYYGISTYNDDKQWLNKAIDVLHEALNISGSENYLHYNFAICLKRRDDNNDMELALKHILRCLELDGDKLDDDHLETACEIMYALNDENLSDYLALFEKANPIKAGNFCSKIKND